MDFGLWILIYALIYTNLPYTMPADRFLDYICCWCLYNGRFVGLHILLDYLYTLDYIWVSYIWLYTSHIDWVLYSFLIYTIYYGFLLIYGFLYIWIYSIVLYRLNIYAI